MWHESKQQQLDEYRRPFDTGTLSHEERSILDELLIEVEQAEWTTLKPLFTRQHSEQKQLQAQVNHLRSQNMALAALTEQYEGLLVQGRKDLAKLKNKQNVSREEYRRVLQTVAA